MQHSESNWKAPKGKIPTLTFCLVWERQFYPEQRSALICSWLQLKQHFTSDISYRQRSHHLCATRDLYTQGRFPSLSPAKYSFCISAPSTFLHKQKSKAVTWPFITKLHYSPTTLYTTTLKLHLLLIFNSSFSFDSRRQSSFTATEKFTRCGKERLKATQ